MRRFITSSLLALSLATGGTALADHYRGRPVVVREEHRGGPVVVRGDVRVQREVYRGPVRPDRRVIVRRPVYVNNGGYVFHNQVIRYQRPIIREHYYNIRYRPQIIVENYPTQPGYIWVTGQWAWDGREWQWQSGHYEVDMRYQNYYDDGSWE